MQGHLPPRQQLRRDNGGHQCIPRGRGPYLEQLQPIDKPTGPELLLQEHLGRGLHAIRALFRRRQHGGETEDVRFRERRDPEFHRHRRLDSHRQKRRQDDKDLRRCRQALGHRQLHHGDNEPLGERTALRRFLRIRDFGAGWHRHHGVKRTCGIGHPRRSQPPCRELDLSVEALRRRLYPARRAARDSGNRPGEPCGAGHPRQSPR